jgi:stress response protein SCP2
MRRLNSIFIPTDIEQITVSFSPGSVVQDDIWAILLDSTGQLRAESDIVYYGQTSNHNNSVALKLFNSDRSEFEPELRVNFRFLRPATQRIVLVLGTEINSRGQRLTAEDLELCIKENEKNSERPDLWQLTVRSPPVEEGQYRRIILGEFIKQAEGWSFDTLFRGAKQQDLRSLLTGYGAQIEIGKGKYNLSVDNPLTPRALKHRCKPDRDFSTDHGGAVSYCFEDAHGQFNLGNGEYGSLVSFCPFCGKKAPVQPSFVNCATIDEIFDGE